MKTTLLYLIGLGASAAFIAGYLGGLHPAFDTISVLRLHSLIALVFAMILSVLLRKWLLLAVFAAVLSAGVGLVMPYFIGGHAVGGVTLMQSNLLFRNTAEALGPYTQETQPDILTLQEVTDRNRPSLIAMKDLYPTQNICPGHNVAAILSKFPEIDGVKGCDGRLAWVRVITPDGPLTIVSLHLLWPWPNNQTRHLNSILPTLADLPKPIIIGGDFNTVPWSHTVHRIETATGTRAISGIRLSFDVYKGWGRFPIDHILVPIDAVGEATLGPPLGSDHKSVLAQIDN